MSSALEINLERIDICEIQDELPMTGKTGLIFFHTGSHPTRTKKGGGNKNFCQTHPGSLIQEVKNNGSPMRIRNTGYIHSSTRTYQILLLELPSCI
jgi:hypothetical protein